MHISVWRSSPAVVRLRKSSKYDVQYKLQHPTSNVPNRNCAPEECGHRSYGTKRKNGLLIYLRLASNWIAHYNVRIQMISIIWEGDLLLGWGQVPTLGKQCHGTFSLSHLFHHLGPYASYVMHTVQSCNFNLSNWRINKAGFVIIYWAHFASLQNPKPSGQRTPSGDFWWINWASQKALGEFLQSGLIDTLVYGVIARRLDTA